MAARRVLIAAAAAAAGLSIAADGARAAGSVSGTVGASATILSPYSLSSTMAMSFGSITRPSNGGSNLVTLDANDSVTLSGPGDGAVVGRGGSTARFTLLGASTTYSSSQTIVMTPAGLGTVSAALPVATNGTYGTVPATEFQELKVGGSFSISAATPATAYSGTLSLTVNYN